MRDLPTSPPDFRGFLDLFSMQFGTTLARIQNSAHQSPNRTRQGDARKCILKPAGHFFSRCAMKGGQP